MADNSQAHQAQEVYSSRKTRRINGGGFLPRITSEELKPLAIVDSNILIYALIRDYPTKLDHEKCLGFLEKGLKGELEYTLAVNPIVVVEVFTTLRRLSMRDDAEKKLG